MSRHRSGRRHPLRASNLRRPAVDRDRGEARSGNRRRGGVAVGEREPVRKERLHQRRPEQPRDREAREHDPEVDAVVP